MSSYSRKSHLSSSTATTHSHTMFDSLATEAGQQKIVDAINDINISAEIGDITVESSDSITHQKLDTLNSAVSNKHLNYEVDSISVANFPSSFQVSNFPTSTEISNFPASTEVSNFPSSFQVSNFPTSTEVSNLSEVPLITGFATEETLNDIKTKTDNLTFNNNDGVLELNTFDSQVYTALGNVVSAVNNKHLDSTTDSVTVVGTISIDTTGLALETTLTDVKTAVEKLNNDPILTDAIQVSIKNSSLDVNITGGNNDYSTETKQDTQIEELEKVVNKKGDIEAVVYHNEGATIWVDSVPEPTEYEFNPNGWLYYNAEAGNAMNLYYFNGTNETKTLNQVVGQYAVVSNLLPKLNNSLIFSVYTKGSPFYTTRITHSPASGVNLTAGGKFLCYWGSIDDNIYPSLPRLNFTDITTTGPAVGTEEILSVSLNTDSATPAGDIAILVESIGVVFNNGSVNQSRVLNLQSSKTIYTLTDSNTQFNQLSLAYLNNLTKTNGGLDVYIKNDNIAISNTSFEVSNFPTTQNAFITNDEYTPIPITGNVGISGNVNVIVSNVSPISITGTVDINTLPTVDISNDFTLNTTTEATNTKLDTIHNDLDGLTFDGSSNLNVNVASGTLTVDSVKIKASNGDNLTATSLGGSKSGLDTASNIYAYAGDSTRTAITCDSAGKMNVRSHMNDYLGNGITSTTTSISGGATNSLDSASSLYVSNGSTRTALTATGSSLNTNITNTVPVSGTVAFSNTSIEISNLPTTQPVSGTVAISNTSINSRIYGSSNGTDWHHILTTPQGRIINNSATQDGNGTNITSTLVNSKQGLDMYVVNFPETQPVSGVIGSYTRDGNGNPITSTLNGATKQSLDVNVSNTVPVSGNFWQETQPISGNVGISANQSVKIYDGTDTLEVNSIPSNIVNTKGINTQALLFTETQNNTLETTTSTVSTDFNAIDCNLTAYNRTNSDYQRLTSVQPIGSANTRALETYAYNVGLNNSSNLPLPITSTTTDTTQSLDVVVNNASTTNYQSNKGINIYPNLMKFRTYPIDGNAGTGAFSALTANSGSIINISNASLIFGASYLKSYYAQISGTGATSKFMMVDYVNSSGVEVIGQAFTVTTSSVIFLTNVWGVNRVYLSTSAVQQALSANETINIAYIQSSTTVTTQQITQYGEQNMSYTVPLNSIACITSFQFATSGTEALNINKFCANGTRHKLRTYVQASNFNQIANMSDGGICGFIQGGETIIFSTESASVTSKRIMAEVNVISNT